MISSVEAGKMNRMAAKRIIDRKALQKIEDLVDEQPEDLGFPQSERKWRVMKNITVVFVGNGALRLKQGTVIEDPAVAAQAKAAGAELRPIA